MLTLRAPFLDGGVRAWRGGVDRPGMDLAAIGRLLNRLTERHAERMAALGLDS